MEQLSNEPSPQRNNCPDILKSAESLGTPSREIPTFSSVTIPESDIVTLDDNSNDPTIPYGFGGQQTIVLPSLKDLNLPSNSFNKIATMAVVHSNPTQHDDDYNPQSPGPSEPSANSTPTMNVRTIEGWETPHTTTDDNTFYSEVEPRRVYWNSPLDETFHSQGQPRRIYLLPSPSPPSPPRKIQKKLKMGKSFPKRGGVLQRICEACEQLLPTVKDIPGSSTKED